MDQKIKLSVVIPAFNEADGIADVVSSLQKALIDYDAEIIVVDDGSSDTTRTNAAAAGAIVVTHKINRGYGAALKTGIRKASHDIIATLDADGQHNPADLLRLLQTFLDDYDTVIGVRDKRSFQYSSRMPGKKFLQWFAGYLVEVEPGDVNSGMRVFRKADAMRYFPILPNGFSFSTTLTLSMYKDAFQVGEIPITTNPRFGRKSTVKLKDGFRTIMLIVRIAALFNPLKVFFPISIALFLTGFLYTVINITLVELNIPTGADFLMIAGIIVFFFGILADQLASIRRGG